MIFETITTAAAIVPSIWEGISTFRKTLINKNGILTAYRSGIQEFSNEFSNSSRLINTL